jgi:hypothetical protein
VWEFKADAPDDLIRADNRLYAAGKDSIVVLSLAKGDAQPTSTGC